MPENSLIDLLYYRPIDKTDNLHVPLFNNESAHVFCSKWTKESFYLTSRLPLYYCGQALEQW
jgi:hypothetical protein